MDWLILLTFCFGLMAGFLSGVGGGGGGFIMMPYLLFIGLPPANALATIKLGNIGGAIGAITAFKGKGLVDKRLIGWLMAITFVCALVAAWVIPKIDPALFENIIGTLLILAIPTLFIKKASLQPGPRTKKMWAAGFVAYTIICLIAVGTAAGIGSLLVLVLMLLFGLNALEANATKRVAHAVQSLLLFVLLALQGLVYWLHGIAGVLGAALGSHVGTHVAIKKGAGFVKIALAITMAISGTVLLIW